jgi:hypothetical protein
MEQHKHVQVKNIHLTIREGLNEIKQWIFENPNAPAKLPYRLETKQNID